MLKKLPKELREKKLWINGRLDDKSPCSATGYALDPTNRDNFVTYEQAVDNFIGNEEIGVGFVFKSTKKNKYVGIDFDYPKEKPKWLNHPELKKKMLQLCKASGSYYERSTNAGYHILGKLDKAAKIGRKGKIRVGKRYFKFEIYSHDHYFLCTGRRGKASPRTVESVQPIVNKLLGLLTTPPVDKDVSAPARATSPKLEDENVLQVISASTQALSFSLLHYKGDLKEYNDDHSAGVMAWHSIIAFYTQDLKQVTRLFRDSKLNYGKWEEEKNRPGGKWGRIGPKQHKKIVKELKRVYGTEQSHNKYVKLLEEEFGEVRRDLFTGDLFVFHEGVWKNAMDTNVENHLKSLCQQRDKTWNHVEIIPSFTRYMHSLKPRLLIDIPVWDGVDRLEVMAKCLEFVEPSITWQVFLDFLKDWGAKFIARIYDPFIQNRCLILQGGQGIGKDVFLDTLVKAMGLYRSYITVRKHDSEKDYAEVLIRSAVVIVSEFDKVKEIGAGTMKDMITKPFFSFRPAYGRKATNMFNRASWLAAGNEDQLLNEVGANRRYEVFKLAGGPGEAIKWEYDTSAEASMQILSQFVALCREGYKASNENEALMKQLTKAYAPEDITEMVLSEFDEVIIDKLATDATNFSMYRKHELGLEMSRICRSYQLGTMTLLQMLKASGRQYRHCNEGRFYGTPEHCTTMTYETERKDFIKKVKQDSKGPAGLIEDLEKDDTLH